MKDTNIDSLTQKCDKGDGESCYELGHMYELGDMYPFGDGAEQNDQLAVRFYTKACEADYELGCDTLDAYSYQKTR